MPASLLFGDNVVLHRMLLMGTLLLLGACATYAPPTGPRLTTRVSPTSMTQTTEAYARTHNSGKPPLVEKEELSFWAECLISVALLGVFEHATGHDDGPVRVNVTLCEGDEISLR